MILAVHVFADAAVSVTTSPAGPFATILHGVFMAVATAAAAAFTAWATAMARRNGVELTQAQQDLLKEYAEQAIAYAEEKAAALAKKGIVSSGGAKLSMAIEYFRKKHPVFSEADASTQIHAALPTSPFGAFDVPGLR